jgi:hypothetical protein
VVDATPTGELFFDTGEDAPVESAEPVAPTA